MILRKIDSWLNNITMYRLLAYGLSLLAAISIVLSFFGTLSLGKTAPLVSLSILLVGCYVTNRVLAQVWRAATNSESWFITALILFFILTPVTTISGNALILLAGIIAMASKYIIARHRKHIFNPAAFAAAALSLSGLMYATWWIGNSVMWPFTLIVGLLVVRKIKRFPLLLSFLITSLVVGAVMGIMQGQAIPTLISLAFTSSPLLFLGFIMLTEPATTPPIRTQQIIYGTLVGLLYALHWQIGSLYIYPEVALVLGNLYSYAVSPKYKLRLRLKEIKQMSDRVYDYIFTPDHKLNFLPGQYLEWTLPHSKRDRRGNRRTFTIAGSPTEPDIHLGVKFYEPSSSYKRALRAMKPGDSIFVGQLAGNFILPKEQAKKLVFVAGGIGITPFRSMLKYLTDTDQKRDVVLCYLLSDPSELSYQDVLQQATQNGVRLIKILTRDQPTAGWDGEVGSLNETLIKQQIPDYTERTFYLSGPNAMIENYKHMLVQMGVKRTNIETDYFPGY